MRRWGLGVQMVLGEDLALIDSAIGHQKCLGRVNWWIVWETARGAQMAGTNCREKRNCER